MYTESRTPDNYETYGKGRLFDRNYLCTAEVNYELDCIATPTGPVTNK